MATLKSERVEGTATKKQRLLGRVLLIIWVGGWVGGLAVVISSHLVRYGVLQHAKLIKAQSKPRPRRNAG